MAITEECNTEHQELQNGEKEQINEARRELLRKSKYAACTTPLMLSMVVDAHSAKFTGCDPGGNNCPP